MTKSDRLTRAFAIAGTVLAWLPILVTVATAGFWRGSPHIDYLMPAELFPAAFLGALLLLMAAVQARARRGLVWWGLGLMLAAMAGGTLLARSSGLASGATTPQSAGVYWTLLLASLGVYTVAVVWLGVTGLLLTSDLWTRRGRHAAPTSQTG